MSTHERFVEPNFLITTIDSAIGRKQRKKRRRKGRDAVYAKVGLGKDPVERVNVEPSEILVPAALPPEIEEQMEKAYAFSSMLTYNQRKQKDRPVDKDNTQLIAQALYTPTRRTFAADLGKNNFGQDGDENIDEYYDGDDAMSTTGGLLHEDSSTLSSFASFSDTASHGMGIASRAMKKVASGASTSFGRSERFAAESNRRKNVRVDRFYDVDGGVKCSLSKSVSKSLFGTAMAHNEAPRFPRTNPKLAQPAHVGPGTYKVSYGLVSKKIQDRWDLQSSSFRAVQRNGKSGEKRRQKGRRLTRSKYDSKHTQSLPGICSGQSPFSRSSRSDEIMNRKTKAGKEVREMKVNYARRHTILQSQQQNATTSESTNLLSSISSGTGVTGGSGSSSSSSFPSPSQHSLKARAIQTPEQRLTQLSKTTGSQWDVDKKTSSLVIDVGKTPVVSPEGSTVDGTGSGFLTVDSLPDSSLMMGGGCGKITPQTSIASVVSVNEYMEDKF